MLNSPRCRVCNKVFSAGSKKFTPFDPGSHPHSGPAQSLQVTLVYQSDTDEKTVSRLRRTEPIRGGHRYDTCDTRQNKKAREVEMKAAYRRVTLIKPKHMGEGWPEKRETTLVRISENKRAPSDGPPGLKSVWQGLFRLFETVEILVAQV
jgi:hypothetical protein